MTPPLTSIVSRLHIKHLRLLLAIYENRLAAGRGQRKWPSASPGPAKALQEIETTFGAALFVRTNRGLEANDLGLCVCATRA